MAGIFLSKSRPSQDGRGSLGRWTKRQVSDQFPILYGRSLEIPSLNWDVYPLHTGGLVQFQGQGLRNTEVRR